MEAGTVFEFEFRMDGYRRERCKPGVIRADETIIVEQVMSIYVPPVDGQEWVDHNGIHYQPMDGYHMSSGFVREEQWRIYEKWLGKKTDIQVIRHSESGDNQSIVLVSAQQATAYCEWLSKIALDEGLLNEIQYISPLMSQGFSSQAVSGKAKKMKWLPFQSLVKNILFAQMEIYSIPEGAEVEIDGEYVGMTPLYLAHVKPGVLEVELTLDGYRRNTRTLKLKDGADEKIRANLQRDNSVVFGKEWKNSLKMQFVPVDEELLVSIWETRVEDYQAYVEALKSKGVKAPPAAGFKQGPKHPVLQVSRDDAMAFCKWLTERERGQERISADVSYRLLTDVEWSGVAGLVDEPGRVPAQREFRVEKIFPWGRIWPPQDVGFKVGNLADETAAQAPDIRRNRTLIGYNDGFEKTAPVGSYPPNKQGIYDLAGNAYEWVLDDYSEQGQYGVLRGGCWNSYLKEHLYVTHRNAVRSFKKSNLYGFRIALAKTTKRLTPELSEEAAVTDP